MQKSVVILFVCVLMLAFQNCAKRGTDTGNPMSSGSHSYSPPPSPSPGGPASPISAQLVKFYCDTRKACNLASDICIYKTANVAGLPAQFGAPAYVTVSDLAYAEITGVVSAHASAAKTCEDEVTAKGCSDSDLVNDNPVAVFSKTSTCKDVF